MDFSSWHNIFNYLAGRAQIFLFKEHLDLAKIRTALEKTLDHLPIFASRIEKREVGMIFSKEFAGAVLIETKIRRIATQHVA